MGLCTYKGITIPLSNLMIRKLSHGSYVRVAWYIHTDDRDISYFNVWFENVSIIYPFVMLYSHIDYKDISHLHVVILSV